MPYPIVFRSLPLDSVLFLFSFSHVIVSIALLAVAFSVILCIDRTIDFVHMLNAIG